MDTAKLLLEVEAEISRLQQVAELLRGGTSSSPKKRGKRAPMPPEVRAKIGAAQKRRWDRVHAKEKAKEKKAEERAKRKKEAE